MAYSLQPFISSPTPPFPFHSNYPDIFTFENPNKKNEMAVESNSFQNSTNQQSAGKGRTPPLNCLMFVEFGCIDKNELDLNFYFESDPYSGPRSASCANWRHLTLDIMPSAVLPVVVVVVVAVSEYKFVERRRLGLSWLRWYWNIEAVIQQYRLASGWKCSPERIGRLYLYLLVEYVWSFPLTVYLFCEYEDLFICTVLRRIRNSRWWILSFCFHLECNTVVADRHIHIFRHFYLQQSTCHEPYASCRFEVQQKRLSHMTSPMQTLSG